MSYPIISLVGRPNVGKSTLFNRLSNSRQALVSDFEGLTRDRQYANIELDNGIYCSIVDTGGLTNEDSIIDMGIHSQVINALNESDVIYFIVSNKDGVTSLDFDISAQLRKLKKNIILGSADELSVKMDEVKKGKVKTQKDKLRKLRGR